MKPLYWFVVIAAVLAVGIHRVGDDDQEGRDFRFVVIAAVLAVGIAIFAVVQRTRRGKAKQELSGPSEPVGPTSDQRLFVQEQVERYRDEMLRYEIGLERHRRNTSREVLEKILAGRGEIMSMPILYLNNDDWMWKNQQLREAVDTALRKFHLPVPTDVKEPTAQAARACEQWAAAEAKRQFDTLLGTDTQL